MSRIANSPVELPSGVEVTIKDSIISVKGGKGNLSLAINELVKITQNENVISFAAANQTKKSGALAGTFRSIVDNMVTGVTEGFTKELQLIGVGYRAQAQGKKLNLSLGLPQTSQKTNLLPTQIAPILV